KLRMPLFGNLNRKTAISRFARTLGTLVTSGVPILQALNITRETAGNAAVARAIAQVHDSVKEGESIVQPLEASKTFPPMVVSMIDVGEETGQLPEMLLKIAEVYDDEVDNSVAALTSLLEPIMIGSSNDVSAATELSTSSRSEEHTSELQSQSNLVCRPLLEKKKQDLDHERIESGNCCRFNRSCTPSQKSDHRNNRQAQLTFAVPHRTTPIPTVKSLLISPSF